MKNANEMTNAELLDTFNKNPKRGTIASEMCKRAGTINYLLMHCVEDDKKFNSCMRDTTDVLEKRR